MSPNQTSGINRLVTEPLLHFFLIGAGLFVLFAWQNDDGFRAPDEIVVDAQRIESLKAGFERTWQRQPTEKELQGIIDAWVREEVLFREGMALSLDQDDPVIRQRIAVKMRFMADSMVDDEFSDAEVEAYFNDNLERYRLETRYSLRQVYFDPDRHGTDLDRVLAAALESLRQNSDAPVGDGTLLPVSLDDVPSRGLARIFGQRFPDELESLPVGDWVGPVRSGYGMHLVLLDERVAARDPLLEEVRAAVETDLLSNRSSQAEDVLYEALLERYTVRVIEDETDDADREGAGT